MPQHSVATRLRQSSGHIVDHSIAVRPTLEFQRQLPNDEVQVEKGETVKLHLRGPLKCPSFAFTSSHRASCR